MTDQDGQTTTPAQERGVAVIMGAVGFLAGLALLFWAFSEALSNLSDGLRFGPLTLQESWIFMGLGMLLAFVGSVVFRLGRGRSPFGSSQIQADLEANAYMIRKKREGLLSGSLILVVGSIIAAGAFTSLFDRSSSGPSTTPGLRPIFGPGARHDPFHARQNVNVRSGPGTGNAVVYTLSPGDITYPGRPNSEGWAPVYAGPDTDETVGFVFERLLYLGNPPDLLLITWDLKPGGRFESPSIVGEIINLTSRTLSYASIECVLLDGQGRQIGTTLDNTTNLGARRIWKFSALVIENGVASYRCEAPTGF